MRAVSGLELGRLLSEGAAGGSTMETVTDSTSTSATIEIFGGKRHVFTQPLTGLTVSGVVDSGEESEIKFTAGDGFQIFLPETLDTIPEEPNFEAGKSYIINIRHNCAVCAAYTPGATV